MALGLKRSISNAICDINASTNIQKTKLKVEGIWIKYAWDAKT
jgi:hypothetical protein